MDQHLAARTLSLSSSITYRDGGGKVVQLIDAFDIKGSKETRSLTVAPPECVVVWTLIPGVLRIGMGEACPCITRRVIRWIKCHLMRVKLSRKIVPTARY